MTRADRQRKHAQRIAHGVKPAGTPKLTADQRRIAKSAGLKALRASLVTPLRERPLPVLHPPIPAQPREVTLAKRAARKGLR